MTWWNKLIADQDVLNSTINSQAMANIVSQSGAIIDMSQQFWSKSGAHEQKMLDIGVLRFPDVSHPDFYVGTNSTILSYGYCSRCLALPYQVLRQGGHVAHYLSYG